MTTKALIYFSLACLVASPAIAQDSASLEVKPYFCKAERLRPEQEAVCKKASSQKQSDEPVVKKEPALVAVTYPLKLVNVQIFDQGTGRPYPVTLLADSNSGFRLIPLKADQGQSFDIPSFTIVEWGVGDFSQRKFSGGAAAAGAVGWLAGSAIVVATGGIAAPLLLGLPFILASGNQYVPDHRIGVKQIDNNGREQLVVVQFFTPQDTAKVRALLETGTGLKAAQRRSDSELVPIREKALSAEEEHLAALKQALLKVNQKKPWCSQLDLSGKTASTAEYEKSLTNINALRKVLGRPTYVENQSQSSDDKWLAYLELNPQTGAWAKANPTAALKLKSCPQSS